MIEKTDSKRLISLADKLYKNTSLSPEEYKELIDNRNDEISQYLFSKAREIRHKYYGNKVYIRGLIEFTNFCKNDCLYCGIRRSNQNAQRYRLSEEDILSCCKEGYGLGFRTFVLQGGEDPYFSDERICSIVKKIKEAFPDCAVTLSIGEKSRESYKSYFKAGADRFLLRHETADRCHYGKLHPKELSLENRMRCLKDLKSIGFQTGTGFMVGSPFQTTDCLVKDMMFLKELQPEMVGIGPFIPHNDTPFRDKPQGSCELTLFMLGLIRLTLPKALIPATTALGTIEKDGREKGILSGANVVMPNLSPMSVRKKYLLYNNKIATGEESAQSISLLRQSLENIGYEAVVSKGDYPKD